jgi:hypothetical protein
MFIAEVVSKGKPGKSYTSILLRESCRVGSAVKSKTLAVLTHLPVHVLEAVRRAVAQPADSLAKLADVSDRSLRLRQGESFGALWTADQIARQLGIQKALGVTHEAELSYWQVLARVLRPGASLLAMVRLAASCAAAALLGWRLAFSEDDLYANGSWLEGRHAVIERRLWQARPAPPQDQLFLCDVTRKEIHRFEPATGTVRALAFSPDGTALVTTDYDDALVWDMTGRLQNGRLPSLDLTAAEMESLWQDLGSDEAWVGHHAAWTLAAGGAASVSFLAGRMHPAFSDPAKIMALRQCLTDRDLNVREQAACELLDLGCELPPADLDALRRPNPAVDARGFHLDRLPPPVLLPLPGRLRSPRAVMALEHCPAPETQSLLDTLADGAPAAPQTREAKAALARWRSLPAARARPSP